MRGERREAGGVGGKADGQLRVGLLRFVGVDAAGDAGAGLSADAIDVEAVAAAAAGTCPAREMPAAAGQDRALHWREAMERIFGEPRSYDTFERLIRDGAWAGVQGGPGERVVLEYVERPGGRRVLESQVASFCRRFDRAARRWRGQGKVQRCTGAGVQRREARSRLERAYGVGGKAGARRLDCTG